MDKLTLLITFTLLASASSFLIKFPTRTTSTKERTSSTGWIHLQKLILPLFENICEDSSNPIIIRLAQEFNVGASSGLFLKPEVLGDFDKLKSSKGFLAKGETFVVFKPEHANELKLIYEIFYFAKDFDTFYKAAAWARQNTNCGLFIHALYLAMLNRRDTEHLSVPAPYELLPNYFITKDYIIKASSLLANEEFSSEDINVEGNSYIVQTNYTSDYHNNNLESKLSYFQEDIGLNTYYFLQRLKFISWFKNDVEEKEGYGEYIYHVIKQLSIRYDLERYSNGLEEIDTIDWNNFAVTPYDPMLIYSNGNEFGYRLTSKLLEDNVDLDQLKTIETTIHTEAMRMIKTGSSKAAIIEYLMDVLVMKELSYEAMARRIMGNKISDNNEPTTLAHYLTSLRDPVFWRINRNIIDIVDDILKNLSEYARNELIFPGVEVMNVEIKKMSTSIDNFLFDVTDSLKSEDQSTNFQVQFSQPRLNHKAFTLKLNISSAVSLKGLVKVYVGPKVAPGTHATNKNKFMLLDSFEWNLKAGSNAILRSSEEINNFYEDFTSLKTLRKIVDDAEFGIFTSTLKTIDRITRFPYRLMIPKGTPEGLPLQMFVFVAPISKTTTSSFSLPNNDFNSAVLSPGFPLDLDMKNGELFRLPNTMIKDFTVTHKANGKVSEYGRPSNTKPAWTEDDRNFNYSGRQNEPFDYTMKKGQYGNKGNVSHQDIANGYLIPNITEKLKDITSLTEKPNNNMIITTEKSIVPIQTKVHNLDEKAIRKIPLLKASFQDNGFSKNDYSYKRKERYDYKTKKNLYKNKVDYSKRRGGFNKIEDNNKDLTNQAYFETTTKNENLFEVRTHDNHNSLPPLEVEPVDVGGDLYDVVGFRPLLKLSSKRAPTVYDYLFPNRLDEYTEDENPRVYE